MIKYPLIPLPSVDAHYNTSKSNSFFSYAKLCNYILENLQTMLYL